MCVPNIRFKHRVRLVAYVLIVTYSGELWESSIYRNWDKNHSSIYPSFNWRSRCRVSFNYHICNHSGLRANAAGGDVARCEGITCQFQMAGHAHLTINLQSVAWPAI